MAIDFSLITRSNVLRFIHSHSLGTDPEIIFSVAQEVLAKSITKLPDQTIDSRIQTTTDETEKRDYQEFKNNRTEVAIACTFQYIEDTYDLEFVPTFAAIRGIQPPPWEAKDQMRRMQQLFLISCDCSFPNALAGY